MAEADLPALPARPADAHKGTMGTVLLAAGSRGMAGAAALAAESALRAGVGYVRLCCPGGITPELTAAVPSAVLHPCGDAAREHFLAEDCDAIVETGADAEGVAVGPGWSLREGAGEWLPSLLRALQEGRRERGIVVDADGLNWLARADDGLAACGPACVLTPHPGEAARLLGWDGGGAVQEDRAAAVDALAERCEAIIVLKGAGTLVGGRGRTTWRNESGCSALATAGAGDVLTGLIAALLAQGLDPWDAARLGAHLHGRAGERAAEALGEDGVTAGDLPRMLGVLMRSWRETRTAPRAAEEGSGPW